MREEKKREAKPQNRVYQVAVGDVSVQLVACPPPSPVSHHLLSQLFLVSAGEWDPAETMQEAWGEWL